MGMSGFVVPAKRLIRVESDVTSPPKNRSMIRTYTMRIKVTRKQSAALAAMVEECRELYNAALGERKDAWKTCRKHISLYDQQKQLTEMRGVYPDEAAFPAAIQRDPLRRVDRAMRAFFRRLKCGEKPGYPRFRSRSRYHSFTVDSQNFGLDGNGRLRIVGLGHFHFKTRTSLNGIPKELRVRRCGKHWNAQVVMDVGPAPEKAAVKNAVGIDLGLVSLATLSDGTEIPNPRWTKREEGRLAEANRSLSRKKRGSKNRLKAREHLRRVHQRIAGLRSSYLTGVARQLVREYDLIAHENLTIRNMTRSKLAKSIMDAAWGEMIWRLNVEAESAGRWVIPVNPSDTTQLCSECGERVPKELKDRWHSCPRCGLALDRDHNAARNILRLGESIVPQGQNMVLSNA